MTKDQIYAMLRELATEVQAYDDMDLRDHPLAYDIVAKSLAAAGDAPPPQPRAPQDPLPDQDVIEDAALKSFDKHGYPEHAVESYVAGWVDCVALTQARAPITAKELVTPVMHYSLQETAIFYAGVIFAELHHGITPKS